MTREQDGWPASVEPSNLREHFATTYRLDTSQIEIMLKSSANSLKNILADLEKAIEENQDYQEISRLGHSLKGVLLNMGELEWAEMARRIEKSAGAKKQDNYWDLVCGIRRGVETFLNQV